MVKYKKPKIDYKTQRKSVAIPDQSLSIQEIVKRFVRGVPVDIVQRQPIYIDQNDHDLEKLSRMDFGEKAEMAQVFADQAADIQQEFEDRRQSQASFLAQERTKLDTEAALQAAKNSAKTTT